MESSLKLKSQKLYHRQTNAKSSRIQYFEPLHYENVSASCYLYQDHQHRLIAPVTDFLRSPPPLLPLSSTYMQLVNSASLPSPKFTLTSRPSAQCNAFSFGQHSPRVVLYTVDLSTIA